MEIRTTYTERQCKEYAHYWSRIYTSGIRRKEDEGGNGRLILSLAVHFLAYLLGWGALRIILGYQNLSTQPDSPQNSLPNKSFFLD